MDRHECSPHRAAGVARASLHQRSGGHRGSPDAASSRPSHRGGWRAWRVAGRSGRAGGRGGSGSCRLSCSCWCSTGSRPRWYWPRGRVSRSRTPTSCPRWMPTTSRKSPRPGTPSRDLQGHGGLPPDARQAQQVKVDRFTSQRRSFADDDLLRRLQVTGRSRSSPGDGRSASPSSPPGPTATATQPTTCVAGSSARSAGEPPRRSSTAT